MDKAESVRQHRQDYRSETLARQLSRVLMVSPSFYANSEARNPLSRNQPPIDAFVAMTQWKNFCNALVRVGLEVHEVKPQPGLEDMCFAGTQTFAGVDHDERAFAVLGRMLHRSRRDEVNLFATWYAQQGYRILDLGLDDDEFLEGGDLLWNADWESIWAGFGHRSTRGAVDLFAAATQDMGFNVRCLELVDPYFYHLNLCLAPLTPDAVMLYPGAFAPQTLAVIRDAVHVHEVPRHEALQYVCSGLSVNGHYITPLLTRRLEQILGEEGLQPVVVDLSEFQKAGGSAAALKMLLP
ncbi:MAG: arginine deiminase-related protein [Acidobacteriota bacterium]|nr:arginine deiminase-related protein [Acidobacteriota bacterium]